jgi:hypothetical protein
MPALRRSFTNCMLLVLASVKIAAAGETKVRTVARESATNISDRNSERAARRGL